MTDLLTLKRDRSALLNALQFAGADVSRPSAIRCPFHEDNHPSAGVYDTDGVWAFKCHGCGFQGDVIDVTAKAKGVRSADILRDMRGSTPPKPLRPPVLPPPTMPPATTSSRTFADVDDLRASLSHVAAVYEYTSPTTGEVELVVVRLEPPGDKKSFRQGHFINGRIVLEAPPKPWPIYNRAAIADAETVVVVEGEKCVHALDDIGIAATCNPGGAGKGEHADWSPLAGKTVVLWPDADAPDPKTGQRTGIKHMRDVAKLLEQLDPAPRLMWVNCDELGLPPKGDVADYIAANIDEDPRLVVQMVLQDAEALGPSSEVRSLIEDTIAGRRTAVPWPWEKFTKATKALLPGTVTVLCGDPGSSKSFFLLEAAAFWHEKGIKCAVFELEEDRKYHLYRALAQRARMSSLFSDDWVAANPEKARYHWEHHQAFIDSFGRCIHEAPDEQVTLDRLAEWVTEQAMAGCRVICIDPVTAAEATKEPWAADLKFLMHCKTVMRQYEASLVLVTHPKKGRKQQSGMDELAGGAAYARFTQTVVWLEHKDQPEQVRVVDGKSGMNHLSALIEANRFMKLRKTRNAAGFGNTIAYTFDGSTLRFNEHGYYVKE